MFNFGSIKEIFLILGGVIIFLFVFYIVLVLTSETKKKIYPSTTTSPPPKISNKCTVDTDCTGNKLCLNGECICYPIFTGENCDISILPNNALQNYYELLNDPNVTEEIINDVFNDLKKIVPGNYKNKVDMMNVIDNLKVLNNPNSDKITKLKSIKFINSIIQKECLFPKVICDNNCVDLDTNLNCGSCGNKCENGKYCIRGECKDCPVNKNKCTNPDDSIICTDINTDSLNCGSCGNICQNGTICSEGTCVCPENSVLFNGNCVNNDNERYKICGTNMIDSYTNEDHCGTCENKCGNNEKCDNGSCVCKEGYAKCDDTGLCLPLNTVDHCGNCNVKCSGGKECKDGNCTCPTGSIWYNSNCVVNDGRYKEFGDGVYYDTLTSKERCGVEGIKCRDDQKCDNGNCVCEDTVTTECSDKCVNYNIDSKNCGGCNKVIPGNLACNDGNPIDSHTSEGTFRYCGDWENDWQNGKVLNISTDSNNCGACSFSCTGGQECKDGKCVCPIGSVWYNSNCVDNKDDRYISCDVDMNNNNIYYDSLNDKEHCGNCTTKCRDDQTCVGGLCVCSDSNKKECNGKCVDTKTDKNNCGDCNKVCPDKQECVDGKCICPDGTVWYRANGPDAPNKGFICIDNRTGRYKEFDGIYYDILTSSERCGTNGIRCRSDQKCDNGNCVCEDSNKTECSGSCVDLNTDSANCGGCGQLVPSNTKCVYGKPVGTDPFAYCPTEPWPSSKYTVPNIKNDVSNCGKCGTKCDQNQVCTDGTCVCVSGFNLCGNKCVNLKTDVNYCGDCGTKCDTDKGEICEQVTIIVPPGKKGPDGTGGGGGKITRTICKCPGEYNNALEDRNNCGKCGVVCRDDQVCTNGSCQCPAGQRLCDGKCVNTTKDNANCGDCRQVVPANTQCVDSKPQGINGFTYCAIKSWPTTEYSVVNLKTDTNNCGGCGKSTGGNLCCNGVITSKNNSNCGGCGVACKSSQNCVNGNNCVCLAGYIQSGKDCLVNNSCEQLQTITSTRYGSCSLGWNPIDSNLNKIDPSNNYNNFWYIFVIALPGIVIQNFTLNYGQDYTSSVVLNRRDNFLKDQLDRVTSAGGSWKVFTTSGAFGANTIDIDITFTIQNNNLEKYCTVKLVYTKNTGTFQAPIFSNYDIPLEKINSANYPYGRNFDTLAKFGSDCCLTPATFVIGRPFI